MLDELDRRWTMELEMGKSHNWQRMAEIEAGLEDGLKGDTFALNTSANFIPNGAPRGDGSRACCGVHAWRGRAGRRRLQGAAGGCRGPQGAAGGCTGR